MTFKPDVYAMSCQLTLVGGQNATKPGFLPSITGTIKRLLVIEWSKKNQRCENNTS